MRNSRLKFKYALRQCKHNEDAIRSDQYAKSLFKKDMPSFWKHIRKHINTRVSLATTINGVTGECNIADMWQDHYKSILNRVKNSSQKQFVTERLTLSKENLLYYLLQISLAFKSLKSGKSCCRTFYLLIA